MKKSKEEIEAERKKALLLKLRKGPDLDRYIEEKKRRYTSYAGGARIYVCFELARRIEENKKCLKGMVDIYPAMNPLGIDSITRGIPAFDLDMNRIFPGNSEGNMTELLAANILKDVAGSDVVLDIHASNIYLTEIPQIRINRLHKEELIPLAEHCNVDFVWVHEASTVLESTFAYSLFLLFCSAKGYEGRKGYI